MHYGILKSIQNYGINSPTNDNYFEKEEDKK